MNRAALAALCVAAVAAVSAATSPHRPPAGVVTTTNVHVLCAEDDPCWTGGR